MNVAWEEVVQHIFEDFKSRIDEFNVESNHLICIELSKTLVYLRKVCKESKRHVDDHVALKYYLFFVYSFVSSFPSSIPTRFGDGLFGISLLIGSYGHGPVNHESLDNMPTRDIVADRAHQAKTLSLKSCTIPQLELKCAKYTPRDLPTCIGMRVAALVGRTRFVAQRLQLIRSNVFSQCAVCGCATVAGATFFASTPHQPAVQDESDSEDDQQADSTITARPGYWRLCNPGTPHVLNIPSACSLRCEIVAKDEIEEAFPIDFEKLECDEDCALNGKLGLSRTLSLCTHVFRRNRNVARILRATTRTSRKSHVLSRATFDHIRGDITKTLNIDTAIVMAAASVAASKTLSRMRALPGGLHWRSNNWNRSLTIVKHRYTSYKIKKTTRAKKLGTDVYEEKIITDELNVPKWMSSAIDSALSLFPVLNPTM